MKESVCDGERCGLGRRRIHKPWSWRLFFFDWHRISTASTDLASDDEGRHPTVYCVRQ